MERSGIAPEVSPAAGPQLVRIAALNRTLAMLSDSMNKRRRYGGFSLRSESTLLITPLHMAV